MNSTEYRVLFAAPNRPEAEAACERLQLEGVPCRVEARALRAALEAEFCVLVPPNLFHRAKWITAQLPPTENELIFLATGRLPEQDDGALPS